MEEKDDEAKGTRLVVAEPKLLKESISILSGLVNEGRFRINPDGIELVAMDSANVAMVTFRMNASAFAEYAVPGPVVVVLRLHDLKEVFRRVGANDIVEIEIDSMNRFRITLKGSSTRSFYLPIMDSDEKDQKLPELKFGVTVTTKPEIFTEAINDVNVVAEAVSFVTEKAGLRVEAEGDVSKAKIEIQANLATQIEGDLQKPVAAKYSIEYLKKMIPAGKLSEQVRIQYSKDYPLRLEYAAEEKLQLSFILAPRVEND